MPTITPDNSPLDRPYPSDPAKRYRQSRVGQNQQGTRQNAVLTVTLNATGGFWFALFTIGGKVVKQAVSSAQSLVVPTVNAASMQTFADGQLGAGNVVVTGGPGASGGGTPYVFTVPSTSELAGQRLAITGVDTFLTGGGAVSTVVETTRGGIVNATTPIGPALGTALDANPQNSPRRRENDAGFA